MDLRCQACGFRVYNRRYPKCETCGAPLAAGLALSDAQPKALYEQEQAEADRRRRERQQASRADGGNGDVGGGWGEGFDGAGDGGGGGD
jgi:ribosomal protein L37E